LLTTADFNFLRKSDAHLYRLRAKSRSGTGDFDDMGKGGRPPLGRYREAVSFACYLLFVCCLMDLPLASRSDGASQRRVILASFAPEPYPCSGAM